MKRALLLVLAASTAHAEPPLAELEDDAAVARQLAQITSDPALPTLDLRARSRATALLKEGVAQVRAAHYEQGLANFLAAYDVFPSPRILMNIGSTLFDMRRYADAANTYQRYLFDPIAQKERLAEVKALLTHLDDQLTILTIRVYPASSQLSIDGGPFMHVEHALQTRVRPGPHTVRVHKDAAAVELTLNGFEGESKELVAQLPNAPIDAEPPAPPQREWLKAGRAYTSDGDHIRVNTGFGGPVLPPSHYDDAELAALTASVAPVEDRIDSGVIAIARIDGKGRGVAGGFGIAIARDHLEGDLMVLRSQETGGYLGGRYRLWTGTLRPYAALGVPFFVFDAVSLDASMPSTHVGIGVRAAAGVELVLNGHLSLQADLGYEHFWGVSDTNFEANLFVPTLGVIGRL